MGLVRPQPGLLVVVRRPRQDCELRHVLGPPVVAKRMFPVGCGVTDVDRHDPRVARPPRVVVAGVESPVADPDVIGACGFDEAGAERLVPCRLRPSGGGARSRPQVQCRRRRAQPDVGYSCLHSRSAWDRIRSVLRQSHGPNATGSPAFGRDRAEEAVSRVKACQGTRQGQRPRDRQEPKPLAAPIAMGQSTYVTLMGASAHRSRSSSGLHLTQPENVWMAPTSPAWR